jgi:broad specificity phosphatase PhoE
VSLAPDSARTGSPASWSGARGEPTRLILVRHGQTEFSKARRYSGRGDPELTETGLAQAAAVASRLAETTEITAVLSSPLHRAARTADLVAAAHDLPVTIVDGLTETDFGAWEGLTFAEAVARDPELHRGWLSDTSTRTPGGESFDDVHERVDGVLREVLAQHPATTVVLVSHVTPIKTLLRIGLAAGPALLLRLHLDLASVSVVEFYPDGNASVRLVNGTSHLR